MKQKITERITASIQSKPAAKWLIAALFAFGGVCTLPWMMQLSGDRLEFTNSIFSVIVFVALLLLFRKIIDTGVAQKKSGWLWSGIFGIVFAICMVFGAQLELVESVPFNRADMWIAIIVLAILCTLLVRYFWDRLEEWLANNRKQLANQSEHDTKKHTLILWFKIAAIILVCYLPVFFAVFPGFFVYDAQDEYLQVVTRNFSTHHPLAHVLLLGGIIQLFYKLTGSYNIGIACYTIFQMLIMSGIFAWCVCKLRSRGLPRWGGILLTLYFGLCPVLVMFSLCSAKDGLFTGMLLIMVMLLQEMCSEPEKFFLKKSHMILFAIASLGMMLLRHNGFYAFLVFIPVVVIYLRKQWKKVPVFLLVIVLFYVLINTGLTTLLHADASENQEMLTVPISQMARVYSYEKENLAAEDVQILEKYLSKGALERYTPKVTDGVKIDFNNQAYETEAGAFWKLWAKWGIEHPFSYLNAWFMTSYGYWYPDTVIDSYRGNTVFTYTYEDSSYFGYEVEQPGLRTSKIPWLDEVYRRLSLEITQQRIPVVSMLFSPGFLFWFMTFVLGYWCYTGNLKKVIPFVLPLLCYLTVLLGPTCLVRYVVFWWALLPVAWCEMFFEKGSCDRG